MSIASSIRKISVYGWQLGEADIQYSNLGGALERADQFKGIVTKCYLSPGKHASIQ